MSTNTDFTITATQIQTGTKPWKPRTFDKNDAFQYCVGGIASSPAIRIAYPDRSGDEEHLIKTNMLHSAEKRLIERSFVEFALKNAGIEVFAEVTKTRVLVRENDSGVDGLVGKKYSAIVYAWKEKSSPPECMQKPSEKALFSTKFSRIHHHHDDGTGRGLRFHWSRVEIHEYDDKYTATNTLQDQRDALSKVSGASNINLYHAPLSFNSELVKLKDIIKHVGEYMQPEKSHWKEIIHAILQKEFQSEDLVVHGTKHYDIRYDPTALQHGLRFCIGKNRQISLNSIGASDPYPLLQELPVTQLFMEPMTVANFVWWQSKLARGLDCEELDRTLRGKNVRIMTPLGRVEAQIQSVSAHVFSSFNQEDIHPAYRGRKGANLSSPDCPTINIGSREHPSMVPAEHCQILPWQTFKHPEKLAVPLDRFGIVGRLGVDDRVQTLGGQNVQEVLVSLGEAKEAKYEVKKYIDEIMLRGGSVIFIEAGIAGSKFPIFPSFRRAVKEEFLSTFKPSNLRIDDSCTALSLTYEPGKDPTDLWAAQLKRLRKERGLTRKDVMAVVVVHDDEHHAHIYQALKKVGDIALGFQTYFVKLNVLQQKAANNPQDGLQSAAHELARRTTIRNPPKVSALGSEELQDLVVAVHVSEFTVNVPTLDKSGNCTNKMQKRYLVVFSSRHAKESKGYAHQTILLDEAGIQTFSVAGKCREFLLGKLPVALRKGARLTILRSGYVPLLKTSEEKPLVVSGLVHKLVDITSLKTYTLEAPEPTEVADPEPVESQILTEKQLLDEEYGHFKGVADFIDVKLSYIYLAQDKDFLFSQDTKATIAAAVAESGNKADQLFFITENKMMNPASNVIRAHRQVHIKGDGSLIKLTLLGYPFSGQEASVSQEVSEKASSSEGQPDQSEFKPSTQPDQKSDSGARTMQKSDSSTQSSDSSSGSSTTKPNKDSGYGSVTTASSPEKESAKQPMADSGIRAITANLSPEKKMKTEARADSAYGSNTASSSPEKKSMKQTPDPLSTQETLATLSRRVALLETKLSPPVPISPPPAPTRPQETVYVGGVTRESTFTTPAEIPEQLQRRLDEQTKNDEIALREFHAQATTTQSVVGEEELVRLAKMWKDDRLNLHNTKWPVPTYLAYLAAKRAQLHLQFGWEKKDGDDDDDDVATCTLPVVHDQVKDSLYFL